MGLGSEVRDPGKNLFQIPDPGVKKEPDPGSRSATLILGVYFTKLATKVTKKFRNI
jgi:hypothetical protein